MIGEDSIVDAEGDFLLWHGECEGAVAVVGEVQISMICLDGDVLQVSARRNVIDADGYRCPGLIVVDIADCGDIAGVGCQYHIVLLVYLAGNRGDCDPISTNFLLIWLAITTIVTILDYVIPGWFAKTTGGHKEASWGAIIGLFAGMFLTPIGMLAGALLGAFIGEFYFAQQGTMHSIKASLGAFLGFIFSTGMKLIAAGIMAFYIFKAII